MGQFSGGRGANVLPCVVVLVVLLAASLLGSRRADAQSSSAAEPTITVETREAPRQGPYQVVKLEHWPAGLVSVTACGNSGRRGSQDCDVGGERNGSVDATGEVAVPLPLLTPPIGCPCVIRVSSPGADFTRFAPIQIDGVPMLAPDQQPPAAAVVPSSALLVAARVEDTSTSWAESVVAGFGGPARRRFVLTLRNTTSIPMTNLSVTAAVGTSGVSGSPLTIDGPKTLAAGEERVLAVPADLETPAVGSYVVHGQIFGLGQPVKFEAATHNTPWGLFAVGVAMVVLLVVKVVRRRGTRRSDRVAASA